MKTINLKILIPNFFTALSLTSGLVSLYFTNEGDFVTASWLIPFSMLCDGLDGKLARLLHASSKFGFLFDTLSDFVVFGVVPGFLAYKVSLFNFHLFGAIISIFYVFCGGYRLVRFTLKSSETFGKHAFTGLPIPAGAGIISSFIIINFYFYEKIYLNELFAVLILITSALMISTIEYLPIEKRKKLTKEAKFFILLALISVFLAIKFSYLIFGIWVLIYILYGIVRQIIIKIRSANERNKR